MPLIRIPVPGVRYALELDSDKIVTVETPRDLADAPGRPGERVLPGPNRLILHFATLDDAPKWVEASDGP